MIMMRRFSTRIENKYPGVRPRTGPNYFNSVASSAMFAVLGLVTAASIAVLHNPKSGRQTYGPASAYHLDLNNDGVADMVVSDATGYKTPLYGFRNGGEIWYVSAAEMQKRNTGAGIDYKAVEKELNAGR